jgi:predicted membrane protein
VSAVAPSRVSGRMIAGAILIVLGIVFTLDNFGLVEAGDVFHYWPLILVGFGLLKVARAHYAEGRLAGALVAGAGVLFLLRSLHVFEFRLREAWPFLLLMGGALLVWQSVRRRSGIGCDPAEGVLAGAREGLASAREEPSAAGSSLNEFAIMGGGDRVVRSQDFRGGEVTAIMGGFEIDLRGAVIAGDTAEIEVFTLWGGVDFRVPEDWNVVMRGMPLLGVFSNSARSAGAPAETGGVARKTLIVRGTAIMGGVEVKN